MTMPYASWEKRVLHGASEHECAYHDAVNRIEIRLKTRRHLILISRFTTEHEIKDASICETASRVTKAVIIEQTVHVDAHRTVHVGTCYLANDPFFLIQGM